VFECFILVNNPSLYSYKYCYNCNKICESGNSIIADSVKIKSTFFFFKTGCKILASALRLPFVVETYYRNKYYRLFSCVDSSLFFYFVTQKDVKPKRMCILRAGPKTHYIQRSIQG